MDGLAIGALVGELITGSPTGDRVKALLDAIRGECLRNPSGAIAVSLVALCRDMQSLECPMWASATLTERFAGVAMARQIEKALTP